MNQNRVTKRTRPGLTPDIIVRSALDIIEAQGLQALSARRLASVLGCEAMSLYYHFPNMDAVLDAVVDVLLAGHSIARNEGQPSTAELTRAALAYLEIAEQHPHAFQLIATRRWHTPNALAAVYSMVDAFVSFGFSADHALGKARILAAYLNGAGMALSAWRKSDGKILDEVATALSEVKPDTLRADVVRADLRMGLEMLVRELTKMDGTGAGS